MASGTYTFTVSRDDICNGAGKYLGKLGDTETFTPTEISDVARFLNMLAKQWMGRQDYAPGLKMWTRYRGDLLLSSSKGIYTLSPSGDNWAVGVATALAMNQPNLNETTVSAPVTAGATVFFVSLAAAAGFTVGDFTVLQTAAGDTFSTTVSAVNAGTGQITIPASPAVPAINSGALVWNYTTKGQPLLELHSAVLRDSQENDTPLDYMTLQAYEALPTKVQPGYLSDPTAVYYEPQLTAGSLRSGTLYLDVAGAQDVTKQLHIVGLRPVQDFVNPTDNPDFPQEWYLPLMLGTAKICAPMFNATWTKEMQDNLDSSLLMARQPSNESSDLYFQPYAGQV